jgi:DNA-binding GntR family transcriptional regulator
VVKLSRTSLSGQAVAVLRQWLVTGELKPGQIYSVNAIASQLGISNTPAREAMLEFQSLGLVEAVQNRGFKVVEFTEKELGDVIEVRLMLEAPAMGRLATQPGFQQVRPGFEVIAEEILQTAAARDSLGFLDADRRFHLGLLELLGNEELVSVVGRLRDRTRLLAGSDAYFATADEHVGILDAISSGVAEQAEKAMHDHLVHVRQAFHD